MTSTYLSSSNKARDPSSEHLSALLAAQGAAPQVCNEESVLFAGQPQGIAISTEGKIYISVPTSGMIWCLESGCGPSLMAKPLDALAGSIAQRIVAPAGLAVGPDGTLFVADVNGHKVWRITQSGNRCVMAGSVSGLRDGPSHDALFLHPSDVAIGPNGTVFVADTGNHRIRTISPDGIVTTLAGSIYDYSDGIGAHGLFRSPMSVDVDRDGICYVADTGNNTIRRITPDGEVTTLAGSPQGGCADGPGLSAGLQWPTGIAIDHKCQLWFADFGNTSLRRMDSTGQITTVLSLTGRRWPITVAMTSDDQIILAAVVLGRKLTRHTCVISVGIG